EGRGGAVTLRTSGGLGTRRGPPKSKNRAQGLLNRWAMLISRCAWHRRYHGYTKILGVTQWRGLPIDFTDGICQKCAARVRADHLRARFDGGASADRRERIWTPGLVMVSLAIVVALVLIARPTHESPLLVAFRPPPVPVEPEAVSETEVP